MADLGHIMGAYDAVPPELRQGIADSIIRYDSIEFFKAYIAGMKPIKMLEVLWAANRRDHEKLVKQGLTIPVENLVLRRLRPPHPREARLQRSIEKRFSRWGRARSSYPQSDAGHPVHNLPR